MGGGGGRQTRKTIFETICWGIVCRDDLCVCVCVCVCEAVLTYVVKYLIILIALCSFSNVRLLQLEEMIF